MNPLTEWRALHDAEIMAGGNPQICILGTDDYAIMYGAIIANCIAPDKYGIIYGNPDYVEFQGVKLYESKSQEKGIMFA